MSAPAAYHIVIADDDAGIRDILTRVVGRIYPAATISTVADGLDALQIADQQRVDLLITNQHMPTMSGLSLVETLRVLRKATLPIVMISANVAIEPQARQLGVTEFLVKPFTIAALTRIVTRLLPP